MITAAGTAEAGTKTSDWARSRRTRYWVLPALQARVVAWLVFISAVVATTVAWAVLITVWSPLSSRFVWAGTSGNANDFFWDASLRVFVTTGFLIAGFGLVALVSGVVISHRVAGPLHRLEKIAQRVGLGQYGVRARLRRRDHIHKFADAFNSMLDQVEGRIGQQEDVLSRLERELSTLHEAAREGSLSNDVLELKLRETYGLLQASQAEGEAEA